MPARDAGPRGEPPRPVPRARSPRPPRSRWSRSVDRLPCVYPTGGRRSLPRNGRVPRSGERQTVPMPYDVAAFRARFPALAAGYAHFDGPGGSQVPVEVAQAVAATLTAPIANRGRVPPAERFSDDVVLAARQAMADLLGADPRGIVFGRSMTSLTVDLAHTLAATWGPGDEVVVTRLDHDANVRPWVLAAQRAGATVRWVDFDPATTELGGDDVAEVLSGRTRVV